MIKLEKQPMNIKTSFDLDGTLVEFGQHFLEYFGFKDQTPPKEWHDKRFKNYEKLTKDNKDFWLSAPRLIDPEELVKHVVPHCYITARPIPNEWSMEWLWKNGFPHAPVYTVGMDQSKVDTFNKSGSDIFVDDAIHNYEDLWGNGIPCLLITRSHNESLITDYRIENISEINSLLEKIFVPLYRATVK